MDMETVITHLQIIHTWAEFARERDLQFFTAKHLEDIAKWSDDAIALLKERKAMEQCLKTKCVMCPHCDNCDVDENGLLKEQEAVEPEVEVLNEIDRLYRCPKCHKCFFYEKQKYCDQCGQAVKWE